MSSRTTLMHKNYYVSGLIIVYQVHGYDMSSLHISLNIRSNIFTGLTHLDNTT